ncbi:surfeit locus protein 2 isoform X2 [Punica granatum]|uniref:Surfeit locus protein 2 isoform X2 n=1 Tax=Punica granatum TaxID=22663 RepID=A0A6P8CD52_PUNGR|nr:surfeit locus protein 2 isoform X2 [Punica granatum]
MTPTAPQPTASGGGSGAMAQPEKKAEKEGTNLLGRPKFSELPNGRFKCVETGHELIGKDRDSYSQSKRCRLGLIDYALSHKKPPLNMFTQDPDCRSKLICKLTGGKVNKSEEHIWKHINGKRFLNKLEKEEEEKLGQMDSEDDMGQEIPERVANGKTDEKKTKDKKKKKKKKKKKDKQKGKEKEKMDDESDPVSRENGDSEEVDFWMPPAGDRWDFDDGGDRWGSDAESGPETAEEETGLDGPLEDDCPEPEETSIRKKRASTDSGAGSIVLKKRKKKKSKNSS